jgi:hypothetical protein
LQRQLSRIEDRSGFGLEQTIDGPAVHQIGADQTGEDERAVDDFLSGLRETQQQEGDEGNGNLDAHGILARTEKSADLEDLLDPTKEQLDRPAPLVEIGGLPGGASRSFESSRSTSPVSVTTRTSRTASCIGLRRHLAWRAARKPMRSERMLPPSGTATVRSRRAACWL